MKPPETGTIPPSLPRLATLGFFFLGFFAKTRISGKSSFCDVTQGQVGKVDVNIRSV